MTSFMKKILLTGLFAVLIAAGFAQKPYKVVFYNFENLFDTIDDPGVNDTEFTPEGPKKWNAYKYAKKIGNLERVLFDIASADGDFPIVIGVSEVENRSVMEDVDRHPEAFEGQLPDRALRFARSPAVSDVGFYYRPDVFKLEGSAAIPFRMPDMPDFRTRDFVTMWGTIEDEPFFFLVSHWPSRLGGQAASASKRMAAAEQVRAIVDSVQRADPATKVVVMGDLNDDAADRSIVEGLRAKGRIGDVGPGDMFNPLHCAAQGGIRFAGLPRRLEPVRQHHRFGQPGHGFDRRAEDPARRRYEVLRRHLPPSLHDPEGGAVQGLSAPDVRGQQFPGRFQRPPSSLYLHCKITP